MTQSALRLVPRSVRLGVCSVVLAIIAGLVPVAVWAQSDAAAEIDRFLQRHLAEIPIPGFSAVVVKRGQVVFQGGYGVKTPGESLPITAQTPIAIGSQAKSFTAVAVMQLVEQGRVDLDAAVVQYLPWFRTADRRGGEITVRHLLHNTSGLPSTDSWLFSRDTTEAVAEKEARSLSLVPLVRSPGQSFEYTNENWTLLGLIVAEVSGVSYGEYMEEHVLDALGMTRSSTKLARLVDMDVSWGYFAGADETLIPAAPRFLAGALAAGSELRVSAEDMGRYLMMLLRDGEHRGAEFLTPAGVETLFEPGIITRMDLPEMGIMGEEAGYAMGWVLAEADGRQVIQHGGNAIVMGSWTAIDRQAGVAASLLYNGPELDAYRYPTKVWVVNNLMNIADGKPLTDFGLPKEEDPTQNDYELPTHLLDRYAGVYVSNEGRRLEVRRDPGLDRLLILFQAGDLRYERSVDFVSEAGAVLRDLSGRTLTTFTMTSDGVVTGLVGGMPGGTYRKRTDEEMAGIQEVRSPAGGLGFQLPLEWEIEWVGERFQATAGSRSTLTLEGGRTDSPWEAIVAATPEAHASEASRDGNQRTETVGQYVWRELIWSDVGDDGQQYMLVFTEDAGTRFSFLLRTPFGERTGAIRDVVVPLMTSLDFRGIRRGPPVR